jgi:hypothetical protein
MVVIILQAEEAQVKRPSSEVTNKVRIKGVSLKAEGRPFILKDRRADLQT